MAITEEARLDLYKYFEDTMGHERATTLMEYLPPVGWGDVATKQDVAQLAAATKQDFAHLQEATEQRFARLEEVLTLRIDSGVDALRAEFQRDLKWHTLTLVATNISMFGLALAAVKLL